MGGVFMLEVHHATNADIPIWFDYDKHISESELLLKISVNRCYTLKNDDDVIGVMRYNLFWDSIPFLTMIYLDESARGKGYGRQAMLHWENEMRSLGFPCVMTSTQADEEAQFFYRKLGYKDAGCLILDIPPIAQPTELFFVKGL